MNCKTKFASIEARLEHLESENARLSALLGFQENLLKQLHEKTSTSPTPPEPDAQKDVPLGVVAVGCGLSIAALSALCALGLLSPKNVSTSEKPEVKEGNSNVYIICN
ncbi:hypothetical protein [Methanorbis furvi]|uniref:Uncharacterized protein n=1 Tax=Methanorbis furvi TaxID=3028299 RepID=A0AAE4MBJ8_9EURY|nr:hypothetical protein [Methanocorpusculaceae archaeon Ag1]